MIHRPTKWFFAALLPGLASVLFGCAEPASPPPAVQAAAPSIEVHRQSETHVLQLGSDGVANPLERERLHAFIADLAGNRPDALHVTMSGSAGSDARLSGVVRLLVADGIDAKKIAVVPSDARTSEGSVLVTVDRYTATAPACAPWTTDSSAASDNSAARSDLGCSDMTNFAAMLADPHDLVKSSTSADADATTAAAAVQRYHEDKVKAFLPFNGFGVAPGPDGAAASGSSGGM